MRSLRHSLFCSITIDTFTIRQDAQGRFCLNDLHRASGGEKKDQPNHWLVLDQTQNLILELRAEWELRSRESGTITPVERVVGKGKAQGTYVAKELVYAYAMWISPLFPTQIRVVTLEGNPWFVAKDVCLALEYSLMPNGEVNTTAACAKLDESEKSFNQIKTLGATSRVRIISESGRYKLIMRSDKPQAKPFQDAHPQLQRPSHRVP